MILAPWVRHSLRCQTEPGLRVPCGHFSSLAGIKGLTSVIAEHAPKAISHTEVRGTSPIAILGLPLITFLPPD